MAIYIVKDFILEMSVAGVFLFGGVSLLWPFAFPKPPTRLDMAQAPAQTFFLMWDDNNPPFTVEWEIWSRTNLLSQPSLLAVVPFIGARVTNQNVMELYQVRARYVYDTNLVSEWNQ